MVACHVSVTNVSVSNHYYNGPEVSLPSLFIYLLSFFFSFSVLLLPFSVFFYFLLPFFYFPSALFKLFNFLSAFNIFKFSISAFISFSLHCFLHRSPFKKISFLSLQIFFGLPQHFVSKIFPLLLIRFSFMFYFSTCYLKMEGYCCQRISSLIKIFWREYIKAMFTNVNKNSFGMYDLQEC